MGNLLLAIASLLLAGVLLTVFNTRTRSNVG
jgi:hypothetical protein